MKTPAIIASLTVVGSIAYAAGSQGVSGKQSPVMPSESGMNSMEEGMAQARMQQSPGCPPAQGQPLAWFGQVHDLPLCTSFLTPQNYERVVIADVNEDGIQEFFEMGPNEIPANGGNAPAGTVLLWKVAINPSDASMPVQKFPLLTGETLAAWLLSHGGTWTSISAHTLGWFDADSDGDLDYGLEIVHSSPSNNIRERVWLENIGYEKPALPVAADLNRDGKVDGADMGLLLYAWGSTQ